MVRSSVLLHPDGAMADVAEVGFGGFQIFAGSGMNGMAVIAGDVCSRVFVHVPEGKFPELAVTGKAFGGLRLGIRDSFAEDENADAPFAAFLHMGRTRAVAAFAGVTIGRAAKDCFFGVGG